MRRELISQLDGSASKYVFSLANRPLQSPALKQTLHPLEMDPLQWSTRLWIRETCKYHWKIRKFMQFLGFWGIIRCIEQSNWKTYHIILTLVPNYGLQAMKTSEYCWLGISSPFWVVKGPSSKRIELSLFSDFVPRPLLKCLNLSTTQNCFAVFPNSLPPSHTEALKTGWRQAN